MMTSSTCFTRHLPSTESVPSGDQLRRERQGQYNRDSGYKLLVLDAVPTANEMNQGPTSSRGAKRQGKGPQSDVEEEGRSNDTPGQGCTVLPSWVVDSFGIREDFHAARKEDSSSVKVVFEKKSYEGWITVQTKSRATPFFRLWFDDDLIVELRKAFLMTYVRSLEEELAKRQERRTANHRNGTLRK